MKSASSLETCPPPLRPEVALVGRSNAGKSSLLNKWMGQRLARVSQTPGKTDLLNFYEVNSEYYLVDLPGYGYAVRSKELRKKWREMVESYLVGRENLKGLILIMDVVRGWTQDEEDLTHWLHSNNIPVALVFNKVDKLNQKERSAQRKVQSEAGIDECFWVSAKTGAGLQELQRTVFDNWLGS